jgi:hypothetical protein
MAGNDFTLQSWVADSISAYSVHVGRVLIHFPSHKDRLARWALWSFVLLLLAGETYQCVKIRYQGILFGEI